MSDQGPYERDDGLVFDVFMSYNGADKAVVDEVAARLEARGLTAWLDSTDLVAGNRWLPKLASAIAASKSCAIFVGPNDLGNWEREELDMALVRDAKDPSFRVFPVLLPGILEPFDPNSLPPFLTTRTYVDLRRGPDDLDGMDALAIAVQGRSAREASIVSRDDTVCPYRGLEHFREEHADWFFGRDADIQRLLEKLKASNFLAIVGASGSGKSSLALAGLVPALREGGIHGSESWEIRSFTPGSSPLDSLTQALVAVYPHLSAPQVRADLGAHESTLRILTSSGVDDRPITWVVDQSEEVFTLCQDPEEHRMFLRNLLFASTGGGRSRVILTMRADFYTRWTAYPDFAQAVAAHQYLVGPLGREQLRLVIEQPALAAGLRLEPGLTETILDDLSADDTSLPLIEHALFELWDRRQNETLTLAGYVATGGVDGALSARADATWDALTDTEQLAARRVLLRLTRLGDGAEDTRRQATFAELRTTEISAELAEHVVDALTSARLVTANAPEGGGDTTLTVAHEAIIRGWPKLRDWLERDRENIRMRQRITDAATHWDQAGSSPDLLWRGVTLASAQEWAASSENADRLNVVEARFIDASGTHESRQASRRRAAGIGAFAVLGAAMVLFFALFLRAQDARNDADRAAESAEDARQMAEIAAESERVAREEAEDAAAAEGSARQEAVDAAVAERAAREEAENEARRATGIQLAAESKNMQESNPALALALAAQSVSLVGESNPEAAAALMGARSAYAERYAHQVGEPLTGHSNQVDDVAFSPDGSVLATAGRDRTIRLWDATSREPSGEPLTGHSEVVWAVVFSPDGSVLASASSDQTVRLWNAVTGDPIGQPLTGHTDGVHGLTFSPDGSVLASASSDQTVRLWNAVTGEPIGQPLTGHTDQVRDVAFSPDGSLLASASFDQTVRLWTTASGEPIGLPLTGHTNAVRAVAFSPDGFTLASSSSDGTVRMWDPATGEAISEALTGHRELVWDVAFSPDGSVLASASSDQTLRLWDPTTGEQIGKPLTGHTNDVRAVAFSPDGLRLVSGSADHTALVWGRTNRPAVGQRLTGHTNQVWEVAFSPDGSLLASASSDQTIRLWDPATGEQIGQPRTGHNGAVLSVSFSPDGSHMASAGTDRTMLLWDLATGDPIGQPLVGHTDQVWDVTFSPDGSLLASASSDHTVGLWDAASGEPIRPPITGHTDQVLAVAFSPNGSLLASGGWDASIQLWAGTTGKQTGEPMIGHTGAVIDLAFSPDGSVLASAGADQTIRLWNPASGLAIGDPLIGHTDQVWDVSFSPDGSLLASASRDGTLRLWDPATGDPIGEPLPAATNQWGVAFSPDGERLAAGASDGLVRLYDVHWPWLRACELASSFVSSSQLVPYLAENQPSICNLSR